MIEDNKLHNPRKIDLIRTKKVTSVKRLTMRLSRCSLHEKRVSFSDRQQQARAAAPDARVGERDAAVAARRGAVFEFARGSRAERRAAHSVRSAALCRADRRRPNSQ